MVATLFALHSSAMWKGEHLARGEGNPSWGRKGRWDYTTYENL